MLVASCVSKAVAFLECKMDNIFLVRDGAARPLVGPNGGHGPGFSIIDPARCARAFKVHCHGKFQSAVGTFFVNFLKVLVCQLETFLNSLHTM